MKFLKDSEYKEIEDKITNLTSEKEALIAENAQLKKASENAAGEEELSELKTANATLSAEKETLTAEKTQLSNDLKDAQKKITAQETELETLKKQAGAKTATAVAVKDTNAGDKETDPIVSKDKTFRENLDSVMTQILPIL